MNGRRGVVSRRLFVSGMFAALGTAPAAARRRAEAGQGGAPRAGCCGPNPRPCRWSGVPSPPGLRRPAARPEHPGHRRRHRTGQGVNDLPRRPPCTGTAPDRGVDGAPGFPQRATGPGGTFDYEFTARSRHVLLPLARRHAARPRPVRRADRRGPARAARRTTTSGWSCSTTGSTGSPAPPTTHWAGVDTSASTMRA